MIRRPPRSTQSRSSAASDVYKRQAAILGMDGVLGFKGWQWIFIIEALPAILLAFVVLKVMTDRPEVADWLAPDEKNWLQTRLGEERRRIESADRLTLLRALCDPRVLALSMMYFMSVTANYGIVFFMPQIIKGIGLSNMMTGFVSSVPYIIGTCLLYTSPSPRD